MDRVPWPLADRYRVTTFADSGVEPERVVEFWQARDAMPADQGRARIAELSTIAVVADDGSVAGTCTTYLQKNRQLRMTFWYQRGFVAKAHRSTGVAMALGVTSIDHLERRFVSGEDRRGSGVFYEIESASLKHQYPRGHVTEQDMIFVGEGPKGEHHRVHWFAGATVPVHA